jgi:hypothetical protein
VVNATVKWQKNEGQKNSAAKAGDFSHGSTRIFTGVAERQKNTKDTKSTKS